MAVIGEPLEVVEVEEAEVPYEGEEVSPDFEPEREEELEKVEAFFVPEPCNGL